MNPLGLWTSIRSQVQSYASIVGPRFVALIWVGAICAAVWFLGPRLPIGDPRILEPQRTRIIVIATILIVWALYALISLLISRRRARKLDAAVTEATPEARAAEETKAEITELRSRLSAALKEMRKQSRRRFGYAYDYPWYLLMGAPGAGKTTLVRSSLRLPKGDVLGTEPVQGVGGTRNCNWWFADQAILIDTAGRYTTQETGAERDQKGFLGFLSMLRRHRRSQPINGVVLTLSLLDLLSQTPEDRLRDIRAIRQRLAEIEETLGARIPVYVVLTKADRLTGFTRFFDHLGQQGRGQVWGMTFDLQEGAARGTLPEIFSREYQALLTRLNGLLVERLQQETDIAERGRIFRFPAQVSALHDALREIVEELTASSDTVSEPLLRGLYFASATQEVANDPAAPGLPRTVAEANRTFFLSRIFPDVILREADLVNRDARVGRRQRILRGAGYGLAACVSAILLGGWILGFSANRAALASVDTSLAEYRALAAQIPVRDVSDDDFLRVLPALDLLAEMPQAFEDNAAPRFALGMDRSDRIASDHARAYNDALGALLLPRYMTALQNVLRSDDLTEARAFETLKHYLSLAGYGPIDPDALLSQAEDIFAARYPGPGSAPAREALLSHMAAMLDRGELPVLQIDEMLVADTRARIADRSPGQRVLDLLAQRPAARALPDWTPTRALGSTAAAAFSGEGPAIDGLLTRTGYLTVVLPRIQEMAEVAAGEDWVRGPGNQVRDTPSDAAEAAIGLYWTRVETAWRRALADLTIAPADTLSDAAELAALMTAEADPLGRLAAEIAREADFVTPPGPADIERGAPETVPTALPFDPLAAPDPFGPLRRALQADEDGADALTPLTPILDEIYLQLVRLDTRDPAAAEALASETALRDAAQDLTGLGRRLPDPMDRLVVTLAARVSEAAVGEARASASALWQAEGLPYCRRAVEARYPVSPAATMQITVADFTEVFGHDGLFDAFFDTHLAPFVDTTTDPWTWRGGLAGDGAANEALLEFQRAQIIRRAFFPAGSPDPLVEIELELLDMDQPATVALFEIGERDSAHRRDRASDVTLIWPGEGSNRARLTLLPFGREQSLEASGPWAPFRLFEQAVITPVSDNQFDATFTVADAQVTFRVTSGSVFNPFGLDALTAFRCPQAF